VKEIDVRQKTYRLCRQLGYWPITQTDTSICPKCHTKIKPPISRPDIFVMHPTSRSVVIEVKALHAGETSFPFSRIDDGQRRWLDRWAADGGLGFIALGVIRQHGQRQHLEHLYITPWEYWLGIEHLVGSVQESIPYQAGPGYSVILQEGKWDIVNLLEPYCWYKENKEWIAIDRNHSLYQ